MQAAHVVANLSFDPANIENMLEASNPSFKFITYLANLSQKPAQISFEYVGLWNEKFDR